MADELIKLLYIVGSGRSGSTILGNVLDQAVGFCHVGELRGMWKYAIIPGRLCGCGRVLRECSFWQPVFTALFDGSNPVNPMVVRQERDWANRMYSRLQLLTKVGRRNVAQRIPNYLEAQRRLYAAIAAESGCRVIVDSSKLPALAYLAQMADNVQVYVLHLVRHPEAVAYSWQRKKQIRRFESDEQIMSRYSPARSGWEWRVRNEYAVRIRPNFKERYMLLRYEDFTNRPQKTVNDLLAWLDVRETDVPFLAPDRLEMAPVHTLIANPNRFQSGEVTIRPDEAWKEEMNSANRLVVRLMTFPLKRRFGYRD